MSATDQQPDLTASVLGELARVRELLQALLVSQRYGLDDIVVGNFDRREVSIIDAPGPGARRLIVPRNGQGNPNVGVAAQLAGQAAQQLVEQNEGRIGGFIVNTSATTGLLVILANPGDTLQPGARPTMLLAPNGGAWDFRLGNALYGGDVCVAGSGGASSCAWGEF